jgi:hypothetical protein
MRNLEMTQWWHTLLPPALTLEGEYMIKRLIVRILSRYYRRRLFALYALGKDDMAVLEEIGVIK